MVRLGYGLVIPRPLLTPEQVADLAAPGTQRKKRNKRAGRRRWKGSRHLLQTASLPPDAVATTTSSYIVNLLCSLNFLADVIKLLWQQLKLFD